jgi:hypothetical protein
MISFNDLSVVFVSGMIAYSYKDCLFSDDIKVLSVAKPGIDSIRVSLGNGCFLEMFSINI